MTNSQSGFDTAELKLERIVGGDPLLKLLARIKISPILIGAVYSVVFSSVRGLVAWRAGHLRTVATTTGFFDDPALYTNLLFGAVVWAYYTWMPRGIATVFKGLYKNRVIGTPIPTKKGQKRSCASFAAFIEEMRASFGRQWWPATSLATAASAVFILVLPQYLELDQSAYWTADTASLILSLLWILIGLYCVLLLFVYSVLSIHWLNRLFRGFTISVRPLDPDRAGGLAPLGNFTLMLSYLIALVGVMFVTTPVTRNYVAAGTLQFRWTAELLVGLGVYAVAAPMVFFAPLSVAHNAMKEAKDQLLLQIARRFDAEYSKIQNALDGDTSGLENNLKTLKELQTLHETTNKFPVWPFNVANLARFGTTYVSPLVLAIVTSLLAELLTP